MLLNTDGWVNEPVEVVMELSTEWTLVRIRGEWLSAVRPSELTLSAPPSSPDSTHPLQSTDSSDS